MEITPALRKQINAAVRENVRGASPLAEVGIRGADYGTNALCWLEDDDLFDLKPLATLKAINDDPTNPGYYELDLYVTTGRKSERQLETNVSILIRDGRLVGSTSNSLDVERLKESILFPKGKGW